MGSLTTHLRQAGSHGHLPFRADCPVCRKERLTGTIDDRPLIGRRAQASLAAALLAVSGGVPLATAAVANPHQAAQAADVPDGEEADPNFDPGGNDPLDDLVTPPGGSDPGAGGEADDTAGAPVDTEPAQDPYLDQLKDEPADAQGDPSPQTPAGDPPPAPAPVPNPPPAATPVPVFPGGQEEPVSEAAPNRSPKELRPGAKETEDRQDGRDRRAKRSNPAPAAPLPSPSAASPPVPASASDEVSAPRASQAQPQLPRKRASARGPVHVVRPGESLWSIASDRLGPRASVAAIGREVNRLWELNKQDIATGDPDLLMVGTVLRLP